MTLQQGQQATRQDKPDPAAAAAGPVPAGQALLLARRAAAGVTPQRWPTSVEGLDQAAASSGQPSPALNGQAVLDVARSAAGINYRRPGAVEPARASTWPAWAAARVEGAAVAGAIVGAPILDRPAEGNHGAALDQGGAGLDGRTATVYPTLAAAMLEQGVSNCGRLWLVMRAWDQDGRGCFDLDQVYSAFGGPDSLWHIGGRRCLQLLLKKGAGLFWHLRGRRAGRYRRLQLVGVAGVAAALGVERLAGRPAAVPVVDLLGGMHRVNAALFEAVLTLRVRAKGNKPISQKTLEKITGAAASTQRTYRATAAVEARRHYAISSTGDTDRPGTFVFVDRLGLHSGRRGRAYVARAKPNTYAVALAAASRGRQRKINKRLTLVLSGRGGYRRAVDKLRIYHDTADQAHKAHGRRYHDDHFWPAGRTQRGAGLLYVVEGVGAI